MEILLKYYVKHVNHDNIMQISCQISWKEVILDEIGDSYRIFCLNGSIQEAKVVKECSNWKKVARSAEKIVFLG